MRSFRKTLSMAPTTNEKKMKMEEASSGNYVPDDIAFCILSKLPIKSIKRFSSVRKSWSLLLENPNFFKMFRDNLISKSHPFYDDACLILKQYLNSHGWNFYFLSGDKFENQVKLNLPPPFNNPHIGHIHILGSAVNGTLCIYDNKRNAILWNPSIDEVKVIPSSLAELPPKVMRDITLIRFGYDHVRNDYKVIRQVGIITFNNHPWDIVKHEPFLEIYSLKCDSWMKILSDTPTGFQNGNSVVYLNGVCHWSEKTDDCVNLVSYDLDNEVFFITPLPLEDVLDGSVVNLQVLNGSLAAILNHKKTTSFQISILGELGVKESWLKLFNVGPLPSIQLPIGVWKKGNIFLRKTAMN